MTFVHAPTAGAILLLVAASVVSQQTDVPVGLIQAINFGGDATAHFEGQPEDGLQADPEVWITGADIDINSVAHAGPPEIYRTGVFSSFRYSVDFLEPGEHYLLRLHFAETIENQPGLRQFDLSIDRSKTLLNYDVYEVAGAPNRAVTEDILAYVDEWGTLSLEFKPSPEHNAAVLSAVEVLEPTERPHPAAWWPFNELDGPVAEDTVGARNGTIMGPVRDIGRLGGALRFDGVDDYVRAEDVEGLFDGPFSVFCWVKGTAAGRVIVSLRGGASLLASSDKGYLDAEIAAGEPVRSSVPIIRVENKEWHHIGLVYSDAQQLILYVDDVEVAREHRLPSPDPAEGLYFGCASEDGDRGRFWIGLIDDIRVYDRGLTSEEVHELWDKAQRVETDYYYIAPEQRVPVMIDLDKIGAVPFGGEARVGDGKIRTFASSLDLKVVQTVHPTGIIIQQLPAPASRAELARFVRDAGQKDDNPFGVIGLTVAPGQAVTPMLLTDAFVAQFTPEATPEQIEALNKQHGVRIVKQNRYRPTQYLLSLTWESQADALAVSHAYHDHRLTEYAHPDFVMGFQLLAHTPNDEFYEQQWHLDNKGGEWGAFDADVDAPQAWDFTWGDPNLVIAVVDSGFDADHPDLLANLWRNPGETPNNGADDDENDFADDVCGWNFLHGTNDLTVGDWRHGTAAAGCAGARGDNEEGVTGTCPNCQLMLLTTIVGPKNCWPAAEAIYYARYHGADIITNSWSYGHDHPCPWNVRQAIEEAAEQGRDGLGCVILFAVPNDPLAWCGIGHLCSIEQIISVGAASNTDSIMGLTDPHRRGGYGDCMDVLAPAHRGTRWITTTDPQGRNGYNIDDPPGGICPCQEISNQDYTACFNGSSAACPIAAGVVGLMLSTNPELTRLQVQRLLQDTSDRVQDSIGCYDLTDGFSRPPLSEATHGYGRINAFEAVRIAAPKELGGRAGVDILLRDNRLDWGNTEQPSHLLFEPERFEPERGFIPYWESVDIKVDAPPLELLPLIDAATFDALADEIPKEAEKNRVHVRIRNRGYASALITTVRLYWCLAGTAFPALPTSFWSDFEIDDSTSSEWRPLGSQSIVCLRYSGSSVAGTDDDAAQVVSFDFPVPAKGPRHYCFLAIIDSDQDPVSPESTSLLVVDAVTPNDNNVTQRNVIMVDTTNAKSSEVPFYLRNPYDQGAPIELKCDAPAGWAVFLDGESFPFVAELSAGQAVLKTLSVEIPDSATPTGDVVLMQTRTDTELPEIMGGLTCRFGPM